MKLRQLITNTLTMTLYTLHHQTQIQIQVNQQLHQYNHNRVVIDTLIGFQQLHHYQRHLRQFQWDIHLNFVSSV